MDIIKLYAVIENFHNLRIQKIKDNLGPQPMTTGGKIALFMIPEDAFREFKEYDLFHYQTYAEELLKPLFIQNDNYKRTYNFDGLLQYALNADGNCSSYVQLHRNGVIEACEGGCFLSESHIMPAYVIEQEIIFKTNDYFNFQQEMGIDPPVVCYLDLLGVKGFEIQDSSINTKLLDIRPFDQDDLHLPKVTIERVGVDTSRLLKLSFDRLWNTCGYPRSFGYNPKGKKIYYSLKKDEKKPE